jgi:hypothetical protein
MDDESLARDISSSSSSSSGVVSYLSPGTYTVLVADYNSAVSTTTPVVSGSVSNVTITAGKQTSVTVNCVPSGSSLLQTLSFSSGSAQATPSLAASGEQWYKLSLTSGTPYYFTQTNGNFAFCLWSGDGTTNCNSSTSYFSYTPTSTGTYYLVVTSLYATSTVSTTVTVSTTAPGTSEGTTTSPISLTADTSHAFVIPSSGYSYYSFTTGSAGTYALELSAEDWINYTVYSDSGFTTQSSISNSSGQFSQGTLFPELASNTTYYITLEDGDGETLLATGRVASPSTIAGYPYQNAGSASSPASLTLGTARNDSVGYHYYDSVSYYKFTTGSGEDYTFSLSGATGYMDAEIYSDPAFSNEVGNDDFDASPSANGSGQLVLAPATTYYIAVYNDGADGYAMDGENLTATYSYTIELSAASVPSFTTLTPSSWTSGSNSTPSSYVWYSATVNAGDTYMLKCNDANSNSSSYTARVAVDAYEADRCTSYFTDVYSDSLSSSTFTIPSGQSTVYFCVYSCSGTYELELVDLSTTGTINITAQ